MSDARSELPHHLQTLHLLQRSLDTLALANLITQALVGGCQFVHHRALAGDVAHRGVHHAFVGDDGPGQPTVAAIGVAHAIDEAGGDVAVGNTGSLAQGRFQIVQMDQFAQGLGVEIRPRPAQSRFPGRVEGNRRHVETHHPEQLPGQLPSAVALAGALHDAFIENFVELVQRLSGVLSLADVLHDTGEAHALAVFEQRATVGKYPALDIAFDQQTMLDLKAGVGRQRRHDLAVQQVAIVRVAAGKHERHAHRRTDGQVVEGLAALVPEQGFGARVVGPDTHFRGLDGQVRADLGFLEGLLGVLAFFPLAHLGDCAVHCLGQHFQVLLEHIVDGAHAHHLDRMLLAENAGQENERGLRGKAQGTVEHLGA